MNAPSSPWSAPKVSRLWSAKGDDRCSPPRSDDYKEWSLMQLKREITQRQLKTNPRRRNKDAFVRVLLLNDEDQRVQQTQTQTQNAPQNQQQPLEDPVMFVPTSTAELQNIYVNNGDQQQQDIYNTGRQPPQDVYGNNGAQQRDAYNAGQQPQQHDMYSSGQQRQEMYMEHQQEVYANTGDQQQNFMSNDVNVGVMQAAPLTPPAPPPQVQAPAQSETQTETQTQVEVVALSTASDAEVEPPQNFLATKRPRVERAEHENEGSENAHNATSEVTRPASSAQQAGQGSTEYLRRKLNIQAARLEIESRRLDLETKREQRDSELHAVQLAMAKEQLQQAKMTTQKMKTEWTVEQMIQKKRLSDAGISQEDTAALGMYLS